MSTKRSERKRRIRSLFSKYVIFFAVVEMISLTVFGGVLGYFLVGSWEDVESGDLLCGWHIVNLAEKLNDAITHLA